MTERDLTARQQAEKWLAHAKQCGRYFDDCDECQRCVHIVESLLERIDELDSEAWERTTHN
jgi:hypothetical protein